MLISASLACNALSLSIAEELPPVQVRERIAPWGTVVERSRFYVKEGKEVEHGLQESFEPDGTISSRLSYSHGKEDGVSVFFYDTFGTKQSELSYTDGVENGWSRTWNPEGKLLFEGLYKDGREWDGWFERSSSSRSGIFHREGASWEIVQRKGGKPVPGGKKELEIDWRSWSPGKLPDHRMFIRWRWISYGTQSGYRFKDRMPAYQDVPFLIGCIKEKGEGYEEAGDQLEALTRVQYGTPWMQSDEERAAAVAKWREWWEQVGKHRPESQEQLGVRDAEAWDLVRRGRDLPVPEEPLLIPDGYVLEAHFRSGDYGGVTTETLRITRSKDGAELTRRFSTRLNGPVTEERWVPFGIKDADRVVRAIGYLVDRPWLINDEAEIERLYWASEKKGGGESLGKWCDEKIRGRESYGAPYYPNAGYELRDAAGKLWWNSDPDRWYGCNPERFNEAHQPVPGVVFPFLAAMYPESSRSDGNGKSGWISK